MKICLSAFIMLVFSISTLAQDLKVYRLSFYGNSDGRDVRFIPLTDMYPWSDHRDSLVVKDEYLGDADVNSEHFHVLESNYRARFLSRLNLDESDNIYIYHFELDSVFKVPVREANLIAFVTPYGTYSPIPQTDYMIGFEMNDSLLPSSVVGKYFSNGYVFVGPGNPFITGKMERIKWVETDSTNFPKAEIQKNLQSAVSRYLPISYYKYSSGDFEYHLKNLGIRNGIGGRQLVVVNKHTQNIELNQLYFDSEGTYLLPLNGVEEERGIEGYQYTGQLFRFKPRIVVGFYGTSFGCTRIHFVSAKEKPINIRCDNRH